MQRRVQLAVLATALAAAVVPPGIAAAHDNGVHTTTITVVADGLDTPRGVIFDADNERVLVAEAGEGGPSQPNGGICGHANGGALYCYGETGAVFQYSTDSGHSHRIITGLPSIANYNAAGNVRRSVLGLHDLSEHDGELRGVFGLSGRQAFRDVELVGGGAPGAAALSQVVRFLGGSGSIRPETDLVAFEEQHNPHPAIVDADPYGMITDSSGTVVADAAGNDVLRVRQDGSIEVLAGLPTRVPAANLSDTVESVPTTVEKGPDGAYYIGELSGFPYYKGEAKVWRVVPGEQPTVYAEGFTNIADITFDGSGRLVVLEMSMEGLYAGRGTFFGQPHSGDTVTGRLVRVESNGTQTNLVTTGLENPGGVAYAGNGVFYVTNRTTGVGDTGQLLKIQVES